MTDLRDALQRIANLRDSEADEPLDEAITSQPAAPAEGEFEKWWATEGSEQFKQSSHGEIARIWSKAAWQAATAALAARLADVERERDEARAEAFHNGENAKECAQVGADWAKKWREDLIVREQAESALTAAQARIAELEGMLAEADAVIAYFQFDEGACIDGGVFRSKINRSADQALERYRARARKTSDDVR